MGNLTILRVASGRNIELMPMRPGMAEMTMAPRYKKVSHIVKISGFWDVVGGKMRLRNT